MEGYVGDVRRDVRGGGREGRDLRKKDSLKKKKNKSEAYIILSMSHGDDDGGEYGIYHACTAQ